MSWTTASDVIDSWIGEDAPTDVALIDIWIGKAEREIRFRVPDLQARLDTEAGLLPPVDDLLKTAIDVTVAMVTRVFQNFKGIRQTNTTTGPFTESATYGGDNPGSLALTADELDKLQGQSVQGAAFTVSMIPTNSYFSTTHDPNWWVTP